MSNARRSKSSVQAAPIFAGEAGATATAGAAGAAGAATASSDDKGSASRIGTPRRRHPSNDTVIEPPTKDPRRLAPGCASEFVPDMDVDGIPLPNPRFLNKQSPKFGPTKVQSPKFGPANASPENMPVPDIKGIESSNVSHGSGTTLAPPRCAPRHPTPSYDVKSSAAAYKLRYAIGALGSY